MHSRYDKNATRGTVSAIVAGFLVLAVVSVYLAVRGAQLGVWIASFFAIAFVAAIVTLAMQFYRNWNRVNAAAAQPSVRKAESDDIHPMEAAFDDTDRASPPPPPA